MSDKKDSSKFRDAFQEKAKSADKASAQDKSPAKPASPGSAPSSASQGQAESIFSKQFMFFGPRLSDMAVFCRQLSMLLNVGITLVRSLRILADRSQHPGLKSVAGEVAKDVESIEHDDEQ